MRLHEHHRVSLQKHRLLPPFVISWALKDPFLSQNTLSVESFLTRKFGVCKNEHLVSISRGARRSTYSVGVIIECAQNTACLRTFVNACNSRTIKLFLQFARRPNSLTRAFGAPLYIASNGRGVRTCVCSRVFFLGVLKTTDVNRLARNSGPRNYLNSHIKYKKRPQFSRSRTRRSRKHCLHLHAVLYTNGHSCVRYSEIFCRQCLFSHFCATLHLENTTIHPQDTLSTHNFLARTSGARAHLVSYGRGAHQDIRVSLEYFEIQRVSESQDLENTQILHKRP